MSRDQQRLISAYQMRNALAHGYFKVDFAVVWKTIQSELPGFQAQILDARARATQ